MQESNGGAVMSECKCAISLTGKTWAIDFIRSNMSEIINDKFDTCGNHEIIDQKKVYEDPNSNCDTLEISITFTFYYKSCAPDDEFPKDAMREIESIPGVIQLLAISNEWDGYHIWSGGRLFQTEYDGSGILENIRADIGDDMFEQTSKNKGSSS